MEMSHLSKKALINLIIIFYVNLHGNHAFSLV